MPCYTITFFTNYGEVGEGGHYGYITISSAHVRTFIVNAEDERDALSIFVDNYRHHRSIREFLINMIFREGTLPRRRFDRKGDESYFRISEYIDDNGIDDNNDDDLFEIIDNYFDDFKAVVFNAVNQDPAWISVQPCESLLSGSVTKSARIGGKR